MPEDGQSPAEKRGARRWSWWLLWVAILVAAVIVAVVLQVFCDA